MNQHHYVSKSVVLPRNDNRESVILSCHQLLYKAMKFEHEKEEITRHKCMQFKRLITVSSTITPLKPLYSQLIGVSEPTLPDIVTTKGNTLFAASSNCAEMLTKKNTLFINYVTQSLSLSFVTNY